MERFTVEVIEYTCDVISFLLVTTDLYGRHLEKVSLALVKFGRPNFMRTTLKDIILAPFAVMLFLFLLHIAALVTGAFFIGLFSLFGITLSGGVIPPDETWGFRLFITIILLIIAPLAWLFTVSGALVALSVPLAALLAVADKVGLKGALIATGALFFIAARALSFWVLFGYAEG
jgi:hypothetical protein